MIQRIVTGIVIHCYEEPLGQSVQVTIKFIESDAAGGRMCSEVQRYEELTIEEAQQVVEDVSSGCWVGQSISTSQLELFDLV